MCIYANTLGLLKNKNFSIIKAEKYITRKRHYPQKHQLPGIRIFLKKLIEARLIKMASSFLISFQPPKVHYCKILPVH
jgi:hypothetical protein